MYKVETQKIGCLLWTDDENILDIVRSVLPSAPSRYFPHLGRYQIVFPTDKRELVSEAIADF